MRTLFLALCGFILAACSGETMDPIDPNDPLASYIPWDSERPEVQTTESGLQYIVVREGEEGGDVPGPRDRVSVMYDGRLVDG
ncbi:MAG: FKBP-type peptidylprolyl isomerase, partial [Pseudomonadota bacterium]